MVPPDSYRDTYSVLLRKFLGVGLVLPTRLSLSLAGNSMPFGYLTNYHIGLLQPPANPACAGKTGFRLFRFRSPLLTKSRLIYFPRPTWMFRFGRFPHSWLYSNKLEFLPQSLPQNGRGFPIRTPSDQSFLGSSPATIAALYVLLRRMQPRHSLSALKNMASKAML